MKFEADGDKDGSIFRARELVANILTDYPSQMSVWSTNSGVALKKEFVK